VALEARFAPTRPNSLSSAGVLRSTQP
jgi:hypothetical protein